MSKIFDTEGDLCLLEHAIGHNRFNCEFEEERYQAFKARLMAELLADVHGSPNYGILVDRDAVSKERK